MLHIRVVYVAEMPLIKLQIHEVFHYVPIIISNSNSRKMHYKIKGLISDHPIKMLINPFNLRQLNQAILFFYWKHSSWTNHLGVTDVERLTD